MTPGQHALWWEAESAALGGLTPAEALAAGEREAVLELAMGRPGADWSVPLISRAQGDQILRARDPQRDHRNNIREVLRTTEPGGPRTDVDRETVRRILAGPVDDSCAEVLDAAEGPVDDPWPAA